MQIGFLLVHFFTFLSSGHKPHVQATNHTRTAAAHQQQEKPQEMLVPWLFFFNGFSRLERFLVVVIGRLVIRTNPVQKVVVGSCDILRWTNLLLVKGVPGKDLAVSDPQNTLVFGRKGNVTRRIIQKLSRTWHRHPTLLLVGTLVCVGRRVVYLGFPRHVNNVRVVGSDTSLSNIWRDTKTHAGFLRIQIAIETQIVLSIVGSGIPDVTLNDKAVVKGLRVVTNRTKVGESDKPIGGRRNFSHGGQPGVIVRHINRW
mmetsp:Transcript_4431/g.10675  ORF Transcript_4431/g.10675 Transcript_4431/m.10675 type:complete len:257 (-) Transcript_4431:647-1417(-)